MFIHSCTCDSSLKQIHSYFFTPNSFEKIYTKIYNKLTDLLSKVRFSDLSNKQFLNESVMNMAPTLLTREEKPKNILF